MKPPPITVTRATCAGLDGLRADGACVGQGAQQQGALAAIDVQLTWPCPRRDQAALECDSGPIVEGGMASVKVECRDAKSRDELDAPALIPTLGLGQDEVVRKVVSEQLLAQRRAVVRKVSLFADHDDPALEALPTPSVRAHRTEATPPPMRRTSVAIGSPTRRC